jgi:hypothetical protein
VATKYVKAVHKLTGIVQVIPESWLELIPSFKAAPEKPSKSDEKPAAEKGDK